MDRPERADDFPSYAALSICQLQMHSQMLSVTCQPSTLKPAGWDPNKLHRRSQQRASFSLRASVERRPQNSYSQIDGGVSALQIIKTSGQQKQLAKSLSCCVKVTKYTIATVLTFPCLQVLVMHDGTTLEYDTVPNLLRMQQGAFRAMVEGAGISHEALNR